MTLIGNFLLSQVPTFDQKVRNNCRSDLCELHLKGVVFSKIELYLSICTKRIKFKCSGKEIEPNSFKMPLKAFLKHDLGRREWLKKSLEIFFKNEKNTFHSFRIR